MKFDCFSDSTVAWENTLSALRICVSSHNMVDELDPDDPNVRASSFTAWIRKIRIGW